jgi:hypothetical protein
LDKHVDVDQDEIAEDQADIVKVDSKVVDAMLQHQEVDSKVVDAMLQHQEVDLKVADAMLQHQEVMADSESCPLVINNKIQHGTCEISTGLSSLNRSVTQGKQYSNISRQLASHLLLFGLEIKLMSFNEYIKT